MRRLSYLVALLILAMLMFVPTAGAWQNQVWSVSMGDNFFEPANAAVQPGDTIVFTNNGNNPHTVTADDGQFDSGVLMPGDSFRVTFIGEGVIGYHCEIHLLMTGSVAVGQSGGGEVAPSTSEPLMSSAPSGGGGTIPMGGGY